MFSVCNSFVEFSFCRYQYSEEIQVLMNCSFLFSFLLWFMEKHFIVWYKHKVSDLKKGKEKSGHRQKDADSL